LVQWLSVSSPAGISRPPLPDAAAMRAELDRVLAGSEFRTSERRTRLLKFLVEKAITGEQVKEYSIGVDVDKPRDYDPRIDPAVRVEMGRLRARLASYYATEGRNGRERLEFPKRSYRPVLQFVSEPQPKEGSSAGRPRRFALTAAIAITVCIAAVVAWRWAARNRVPAVNSEVRELTAKARFFWNKRTPEALATSLELYQEAIRKAPRYAPAYAGEALCYAVMATDSVLPADQTSAQAVDAANAAITLDPNVAEAHAALGLIAWAIHFDWATGDMELSRAVALDPTFATAHQWRAMSLLYTGHRSESRAEIIRALEIDPVSMPLLGDDGMISYYSRRYDEAIEKARKMLAMDPAFRNAHLLLGDALEAKGDWAGAEREFQTVARASTGDSEGSAHLARLFALTGRRKDAETIVEKLLHPMPNQYIDPYQLAFVFTGLGQNNTALEWLAKAVRQHTAITMNVDPELDPLRNEPAFQQLLKEAHFI